MSTELQWRRRWKPNLHSSPWKQLNIDNANKYLFKIKFDDNSYEFLITDMTMFWYESIGGEGLKKRFNKLNPCVEASLRTILDQIHDNISNPGKETKLTSLRRDDTFILNINSHLEGMPFSYTCEAELANNETGRDHLTIPLMAMVGELFRQQQELFKILVAKDKQIDDYKSQGAKVSRKWLETAPFDDVAFCNSMVTSKGFEEQIKTYGEKAFTSTAQDLYREINTKRAWLLSSPIKDAERDPSESLNEPPEGPSVESWSNRVPASIVPKNISPSNFASSRVSPEKSSNCSESVQGSNTETPVKDSEFLRRQALERKLEQEAAKEKVKKKKKLKF
ncbi:unnamed protein product [Lymnaea stagnalis]|uniref:Non-homologous end-joining factor 1 n=1 Tax=Lymnaea stagnalis TaxID=6523 RepID=A0AAV2H3X1_LYMST